MAGAGVAKECNSALNTLVRMGTSRTMLQWLVVEQEHETELQEAMPTITKTCSVTVR
jgi:hypothetical protein